VDNVVIKMQEKLPCPIYWRRMKGTGWKRKRGEIWPNVGIRWIGPNH